MALGRASYALLRAVTHLAPGKRAKPLVAWCRIRLRRLERRPIFGKGLDLQGLLFLWSTDTLTKNTAAILKKNGSATAGRGV
jgi:hypothetical protein